MRDMLGMGTFGLVIRHGDHVLKIAKVNQTEGLSEKEAAYEAFDNDGNRESLEREKAVYRRVGTHTGIVQPISLSNEGILMPLYPQGDLEKYMAKHENPDASTRTEWIMSVIQTMCHLHQCKILVDDLALRNLLLTDDRSLKMIDFGNCSILPMDTDLSLANEDGLTVQVDIFYLGCLIYSIAVWEKFEFCLIDTQWQLPPLSDLPQLAHVLLGDVVRNCWTGAYNSMHKLQQDAIALSQSLTQRQNP
ncbi:MAG: hypothetical protein Q9196_004028, partial [Gyalolechia fulgens]